MNKRKESKLGTKIKPQKLMPVMFIGHGSPMNAIEDNIFSKEWQAIGKNLPKPEAILCISAHWETQGVAVTAMEQPDTIHDFGGFPHALFEVQYPAPGSPSLAKDIKDTIKTAEVKLNEQWGLDHGCWSVLTHLFPDAQVSVVQLSLDYTRTSQEHYSLAKELFSLRQKKILIIGSGNMVHNLGKITLKGNSSGDFNQPFGFDWAIEANDLFKLLINENRHSELADYLSLGSSVRLAVPTPEHYLPLLYILALKQEGETVTYFNDQPVGGSLTMTSMIIDS